MRNKYALFWMWMFLLPLALDFKGAQTASKLVQIFLVLPTVGAGVALLLIAPRFARRSKMRSFVTVALLITIVGSAVTQLVQGNDMGNYLRVLLPFLLMLLGYFVGCHPWNQQRLEQIERVMFWSMVVSLFFSFAYGLATGGSLENVRFRIVSVTFLCLQGLLLHEFVVAKRLSKLSVALFLVTIVIELLSVTRSLLVGTVLLFAFATWIAAPSLKHLLKSGARAVMIGALLTGMAFAAAAMFPTVAEHWTQRIFFSSETESGRDPTTITRLAEMKDQYDQTTGSAVSVIAGMGYGHNYRYSPSYLPDLAGQMSAKDFYAIKEWAAGHNFWVYQFFAGGILFGLALPFAVLFALWRGSRAYRVMAPPRARRALPAGPRPRAAGARRAARDLRRRQSARQPFLGARVRCGARLARRELRADRPRDAHAGRGQPGASAPAALWRGLRPVVRRPATLPAGPAAARTRDPAAAPGAGAIPHARPPQTAFRFEHTRAAWLTWRRAA